MRVASFLGVQYLLGRRGSFPYGLVLKFNLLEISLLVIISDFIQALVLLNFFEYAVKNIKWIQKLMDIFRRWRKERPPGKLTLYFRKKGAWGLFLISSLPYGGGALAGSIMAISMRFNKSRAFLIIFSGCILGTFIFYLGFAGIISLFD